MSDDCVTVVEVVEKVVKVEIPRGPQGPVGPQGPAGVGLVESKVTITPASTVIADSVPIGTFQSAKWLLTVTDGSLNQTQSEIWAGHDGSAAAHTRYAIFSAGGAVAHTVDVALVAGSLELQVTNNTGANITARAVRLGTSV